VDLSIAGGGEGKKGNKMGSALLQFKNQHFKKRRSKKGSRGKGRKGSTGVLDSGQNLWNGAWRPQREGKKPRSEVHEGRIQSTGTDKGGKSGSRDGKGSKNQRVSQKKKKSIENGQKGVLRRKRNASNLTYRRVARGRG